MSTNPTARTDRGLSTEAPAASYVLPLPDDDSQPSSTPEPGDSLSGPLLAENVFWFCRFRWAVIGFIVLFGLLGLLPGVAGALTLRPPGAWPFVVAGVLLVGNLLFLALGRRIERETSAGASRGRALSNLRGQIVMDLLVLTAVIHFVGSIHTYALFVYLFHIVLACIFFPPRQSLAVTILAITLYAACLVAEQSGLVPLHGAFSGAAAYTVSLAMVVVNFVSAIAIWLVVWYLGSHLSSMVRLRDAELAATNRRLEAAQRERSRHMLTTTHQLKAPFAAIDANAQLLLAGLCGPLSEDARGVAGRIAARCRRLAGEIQEMLQLANLDSDGQPPPAKTELDLAEVLRWCLHQMEPLAGQRHIVLDLELQPAWALGAEDHLRMLFGNLLSNAVIYSHPGGRVAVRCSGGRAEPVVTIADQGIGIAADKLPHIFQEHYRTQEAVQHNKESSGLGLAIVRNIAEHHRIRLTVQSRPGAGTTFELRFLPSPASAGLHAAGQVG